MTQTEFNMAIAQAATSPVVSRARTNRVIAAPRTFAEFTALCARTPELPSTYISKSSGRTDVLWVRRDPTGSRSDDKYDLIPLSGVMQWLASCEPRNKTELSWHVAEPITTPASSPAK
jgi:hypothetical protein